MDMIKNKRKTMMTVLAYSLAIMLAVSGIFGVQSAFAADEVTVEAEYSLAAGASDAPTFSMYKVGTVIDGVFTLESPYSASGVSTDFSKDTTDAQWDESASTLYDYISANGLGGDKQTAKPDGNGKMTFSLEKYALYVIGMDDVFKKDGKKHGAKPMFVWVIEGNTETISIKPFELADNKAYTVIKHWQSDSEDSRPAKISVELYEDNELRETVELSKDNDWTYSWKDEDGEGKWTCVEKDVPKGYTSTVTASEGGARITITNKGTKPTPPGDEDSYSPKGSKTRTGDPTTLRWSMIAMALSGLILLVAGIRRRKNDY